MNHDQLRLRLIEHGALAPEASTGGWDSTVRSAVLEALTDGPDHRIDEVDVARAANDLGVDPIRVWVLHDVESSGNPFVDGRPTILPEPHRFSRSTGHRYDRSHPRISSRAWNKALYPKGQAARWEMLLDMVALDVDAGFASASYGGFQILGENYERCGAPSPWAFAWRQSQTEADQLEAFIAFIRTDHRLWEALKRGDWVTVARRYNGTAYRLNRYDVRLAQAERARLLRHDT